MMKPFRTRTTRNDTADRMTRLGFKLFSVKYRNWYGERRQRVWAIDAEAAMDHVEQMPSCRAVCDARELKRQPSR